LKGFELASGYPSRIPQEKLAGLPQTPFMPLNDTIAFEINKILRKKTFLKLCTKLYYARHALATLPPYIKVWLL